MRSKTLFPSTKSWPAIMMAVFLGWVPVWAQNGQPNPPAPAASSGDAIRDLRSQLDELKSAVQELRVEAERARAINRELRQKLDVAEAQLSSMKRNSRTLIGPPVAKEEVPSVGEPSHSEVSGQRLSQIEEDQQLLSGKVDEQYQTKVESASKYRLRLSGIVLLNVFSNSGALDNQDFPSLAEEPQPLDSGGSFGAALRQSQLGLELTGPEFAGAKTSANLQLDFAGGLPKSFNGATTGLVRLRTAVVRLDWPRTSLVAGQDALFFSPLSPTSLSSLAVPALSYAGNLWSWSPQIRVEHRVSLTEDSSFLVQGGIVDALSGYPPYSDYRTASPGEKSGQPAYASRIEWSKRAFGGKLALGAAGFYSRQYWGLDRHVDSWAGMSDWTVPLGPWVELTGEFYRGRAIGALGGSFGRSIVFGGSIYSPSTAVQGLDTTGGWTQLKVKPTAKLEFNTAFGQENPLARQVRLFSQNQPGYSYWTLTRNRSAFVNFIYNPRSNVLLSAEYRRLRTFWINGDTEKASQVNLSIGILF